MQKNQHRWKQWISAHAREVLEDSEEEIKWAWSEDNKHKKAYPRNTDSVFAEINQRLLEGRQNKLAIEPRPRKLPRPRGVPKRLSDLVEERIVKAVYEDRNSGSYKDALKLAGTREKRSRSAWRKIRYAIDVAYRIHMAGDDSIPSPRVHFLHRSLLEIAYAQGITEQTYEGILEFLDDLCPCGKKHKPDAIRKLKGRWQVRQPARH
jgi:hypothetical protein